MQALPEVERERILSERSEERQRNLERLEVRKLLNDGRREDSTRRNNTSLSVQQPCANSYCQVQRAQREIELLVRLMNLHVDEKKRIVVAALGTDDHLHPRKDERKLAHRTATRAQPNIAMMITTI